MRRTSIVGTVAALARSAGVAALALVSACSNTGGSGGGSRWDDPILKASEYGQACSTAADCVAIYLGELGCCGASCPNSAIAWTSNDTYQFDVTFRRPICTPAPTCDFLTNDECGTPSPTCSNGVCALPIV